MMDISSMDMHNAPGGRAAGELYRVCNLTKEFQGPAEQLTVLKDLKPPEKEEGAEDGARKVKEDWGDVDEEAW